MSFAIGEIVPTPEGPKPFAVVITQQGTLLTRFPVDTVAQGEALVTELLTKLGEFARSEGYL